MDVSVVTVTWNSREFIGKQIASVKEAARNSTFEQLIVDNASADKTAAYIAEAFPEVRLITNSYNAGFGAANTIAVREAKGEYVLFLNPDMELEEGSIDRAVTFFKEHDRVGAIGFGLYNQKRVLEKEALPRRFPKLRDVIIQIFKLHHLFPRLLQSYHYAEKDFTIPERVDSVRGSCLMIRKKLVNQLGAPFDPRYFNWFEDVDLCREITRLGAEIWFVPEARAIDYVGQSFKKQNQVARQKQFYQSAAIYFDKWEPGIKPFVIRLISPLGIGLVWLYSLVK
jgi:GT2 family glycosyltransferase